MNEMDEQVSQRPATYGWCCWILALLALTGCPSHENTATSARTPSQEGASDPANKVASTGPTIEAQSDKVTELEQEAASAHSLEIEDLTGFDPSDMMRQDACSPLIAIPEGPPRASVGRIQHWVCSEDREGAAREVDPHLGVWEVKAGDMDGSENPEHDSTRLACGAAARELGRALRDNLLDKMMNHLTMPEVNVIQCSRTACRLLGVGEYDPTVRINFTKDGRFIRDIAYIEEFLVDEEPLRRNRAWANTQLARRPAHCTR